MNEILTEAWKEAYNTYLENEDKAINQDLDKLFEELDAAQKATKQSLEVLQEYFNIVALSEETLLELEPHDGRENGGGRVEDNRETGEARRNDGNQNSNQNGKGNSGKGNSGKDPRDLKDSLANLFSVLNSGRPDDGKATQYAPTALFANQSVKDMKFPENIIFFIGQLIKWIKDVVLYFIAKFINLIRRLTMSSQEQIVLKFPALDFKKGKKIESNFQTISLTDKPGPVSLMQLSSDNLGILNRQLKEGYILSEANIWDGVIDHDKEKEKTNVQNEILDTLKKLRDDGGPGGKNGSEKIYYAVSLDFTKDFDDLRMLVQHFYDLFDNAYGSNNEKLFDTQDLEVILELIKSQFEHIKSGKAATTYTLGSAAMEIEAVNMNRVKDNLILTNSNITALKEAYVKTSKKINDIAMVINGKEMLALSQYGVQYKLLTQTTLSAMKSILDTIPVRLKQAKRMERGLIGMKRAYEKVITKLEESQRSIVSVSSVTFTSPYQKQTSDLLNSTRFMSDIITLRLSGLGLYIKELQDTRDLMKMLAGINGKR